MINNNKLYGVKLPAWARRMGVAGFTFFLVKGLAWLAVPFLAGMFL